jgi:hypothetical protein
MIEVAEVERATATGLKRKGQARLEIRVDPGDECWLGRDRVFWRAGFKWP